MTTPAPAISEEVMDAAREAVANWQGEHDIPLHHSAFKALTAALTAAHSRGRQEGMKEAADKAREYAAHYPEASDGRNTFIIFAEWAEASQ